LATSSAILGNRRHYAVERLLAAARHHHGPAVRRQRQRAGLADSAAATGDPGHAFSDFRHPFSPVAFERAFLLLQRCPMASPRAARLPYPISSSMMA
jgi:hypothetical protein